MAKASSGGGKFRKDDAKITRKGDHQVIVPSYNLKTFARKVDAPKSGEDMFDMAALERAEQALANLSTEFDAWMDDEISHLRIARDALKSAQTPQNREALYRCSHDIRGGAATYGYPRAGDIADSLCRMLDGAHAASAPLPLIDQHVDAIIAVVRDKDLPNAANLAAVLAKELRAASDAYVVAQGGEVAE